MRGARGGRRARGEVPAGPDFAAMLGNAVAILGDAAEARRVYDALSARHGRPVLASMVGSAILDLPDRVLLILATASDRTDRIDTHAARALAVADRLGSPVWAARVRADWADAATCNAGWSHALDVIREVSPRLGEHLAASVRTGVYCIYEPRGHNRGLER